MGIKKGDKIERHIDLSGLPRGGENRGNRINWKNCIGKSISGMYKGEDFIITIVNYNLKNKQVEIQYMNDLFIIATSNILSCRMGNILGKITNKFKVSIGEEFKSIGKSIIITHRDNKRNDNGKIYKKYKYKCNTCGFDCGEHYSLQKNEYISELWIDEYNLLKGKGCSLCSNQIVVQGVNDIPTTNPEMVKYFIGGYDEAKKYIRRSSKSIFAICPDCHIIKPKPIKITTLYEQGISCTCGDGFSFGHKYMFSVITQLILKFKDNYTFDWCKFHDYTNRQTTGEYDFVIEDLKLIIEVDGGFHRKDNKMNGQTKEHSKYLDDMKDKLAIENGYKVVRISDEGNIKSNILDSELSNLFDLSKIGWLKAEEFALSNLSKKACELYNSNPKLSNTDIGIMIGLNEQTVRKYLKQWVAIGLCSYNPLESSKQSGKKNGKLCGKEVEIFKDNISLGIFESCMELERQSEENFGVKLGFSAVASVCRGKKKEYKGFTFGYIGDERIFEMNNFETKENGKEVEIFKDGNSKGVFPSCAELERQSLELFRVKLSFGNISAVARGKRNHHKGYTFKYV